MLAGFKTCRGGRTVMGTLCLILALSLGIPPTVGAMEELNPLRGEWALVCTRDEKRTDDGSDTIRMTIDREGTVIFRLKQLVTNRGTIRTRPVGKVYFVDLQLADGAVLEGLARQCGDRLEVCFAETGKPRPASLVPRGSQWSEEWRRANP